MWSRGTNWRRVDNFFHEPQGTLISDFDVIDRTSRVTHPALLIPPLGPRNSTMVHAKAQASLCESLSPERVSLLGSNSA